MKNEIIFRFWPPSPYLYGIRWYKTYGCETRDVPDSKSIISFGDRDENCIMKSNKHNIPGIIIIMNSRYFDKYVNYDNNVNKVH